MKTSRWLAALCLATMMVADASAAGPPRVAVAWAAGPMEARVAFAEAVDPAVVIGTAGARITFEDPAAKARPGGNKGTLRVAAARLEDLGRTLVLVTDPHPREATYSLILSGVKAPGQAGAGASVAVAYDLSGVDAAWTPGATPAADAAPAWSGWWPSFETDQAHVLTTGSSSHEKLWAVASAPGRLTLRAFVNLPPGEGTLTFDASAPFQATLSGEPVRSVPGPAQSHRGAVKVEGIGEAVELVVVLPTGPDGAPRLHVEILSGREQDQRPLPRSALVLPWAPPTPTVASPADVPPTLLTGGDPSRGEAIFRGESAKCASCHAVAGKGGAIGPSLDGLAGADRSWVYQAIAEPSASIHPDYVTYTVALKDGRVAMGVVRAEGANAIKVADIDAKATPFPRAEVEEIRPSTSSIMPVGLLGPLGEDGTRDLLAYLTGQRSEAPR